MEAHLNVPISAERPCRLVARFFYRHAHSTKLQSTHKPPEFLFPFRYLNACCLNARFSSLQEDMLQNNAGAWMITVKFLLRRKCEFGQQFYVIGDNQRLGGWAPEAALPMQWSEGHVWTVELDLPSGTCLEFKVLLKADQDVLEWQPGPNCKLKVSDLVTPLLVCVPWSHDEKNLENDAPGSGETNDLQRTQHIFEMTTSTRSLSDVIDHAGGVDLATDTSVSLHATDETKAGERSDNNGPLKFSSKGFVDEKQPATKGVLTADRGQTDDDLHPNSNLSPEEFFSLYAIPESWYVEGSRDVLVSGDFTEPSPGLLEVNAPGRNLASATEFYVNKEEGTGDEPLLSNEKNEMITEAMKLEADAEGISKEEYGEQLTGEDEQPDKIATSRVGTIFSNAEPEDILEGNSYSKEENDMVPVNLRTMVSNGKLDDIQQGNTHSKDKNGEQHMGEDEAAYAITPTEVRTMLSNAEPEYTQKGNAHSKEENGEQHMGEEEPAEAIAASNLGTVLANAEPVNIQEGKAQILVSQQGQSEVATEPKKDLMFQTILVQNDKPTADEHATRPEIETVETKPAKEKKGGHKGWSKLWNAFVRGRNV